MGLRVLERNLTFSERKLKGRLGRKKHGSMPRSRSPSTNGTYGFVRSLLHRIAGVVLIAVSMIHIWYISTNSDGHRLIKDARLEGRYRRSRRDALRSETQRKAADVPPLLVCREGRILGTGLGSVCHGRHRPDGVWFKGFVGRHLWWLDIAITIQWYEAVATLATIVWHIYAVIFDPDPYPMIWVWFDGRMSIERYEHEHPLDTWQSPRRAVRGVKRRRNQKRSIGTRVQNNRPGQSGCYALSNRGSLSYNQSCISEHGRDSL